jgi:hypothetical protein
MRDPGVASRVLTVRELNRATLSRQLLLERMAMPVTTAIERLVGLQAQLSVAPFVGLWTRVRDFRREDLARAIEERRVVKATLMRATLHLSTAGDFLLLRATLQQMLSLAASEIVRRREPRELDVKTLLQEARRFIAEKPRTFAEISAMLSDLRPDRDVGAMRYTVRTHIPLVQVPVKGGWSYPANPQFTLAESWLGKRILPEDNFRTLVLRYLAAFGPASITDLQTWSGIPKLKNRVEAIKSDLVVYRDEGKRELLDLPDTVLPDADTPAPVRFLPEFDNLLLAHDKRTRVIADEHRSRVYLPGLRVAATFLVDGFVRGAWKVEKTKTAASLVMEPFEMLAKKVRAALAEEGEGLVRFLQPEAKSHEVRFAE